MRHRNDDAQPTGASGPAGSTRDAGPTPVPAPRTGGKHRASPGSPVIPTQKGPVHESRWLPQTRPSRPRPTDRAASTAPISPARQEPVRRPDLLVPTQRTKVAPTPSARPTPNLRATPDARPAPSARPALGVKPAERIVTIPHTQRWKASHAPRVMAGIFLLLAVGGTSALGLDYQQNPGNDELVSLVLGLVVVVGLWAMLIASTPQVVSLRGSVLTIHNSSGTKRFDLGETQQSVELLGEPRRSSWALVLHRANSTSLVLRRRDVDAAQLDPIVRHYREIANTKMADREARFRR